MFKLMIAAALAAGISWVACDHLSRKQRHKLLESMAEDRAEAAEKTFNAAFKAGERAAQAELQDAYERELGEQSETHQKAILDMELMVEQKRKEGYNKGYEDGKKARLVQATSYKKGYEDGLTAAKAEMPVIDPEQEKKAS